jgi:hypothetical protein
VTATTPVRPPTVDDVAGSAPTRSAFLVGAGQALAFREMWLTAVLVDLEESSWRVWNCCES